MKDYYQILGITKTANEDDIKKAYRKLAHKYHPDKAEGDEKKFKEISEAYQILSSKEKRAQYDQFGRVFDGAGFQQGGGSSGQGGAQGWDFNGFDASGFNFEGGNASDIFDAIFEGLGVKKKRRTYEHGADLELVQEITLEEAFHGVKKNVAFETYASCKTCQGSGHFEKEGFSECSSCDGRGEVQETRRSFFGAYNQIRPCTKCRGTGKIPKKECKTCNGSGRIRGEKKINIEIRQGVQDGQFIKIAKAGESGEHGSDPGDLYVRIAMKPHQIFRRNGDDLIIKKEVKVIDIILNKPILVKTIAGEKIEIQIPEGFRLKDPVMLEGKGMPHLGTKHYGNLYVELDMRAPKKPSTKIKTLLEEIDKETEE
ncbi:MAG: molecular chaperone DnaJ [Candidatus Harrisonbacteria bacterium CG10_big_fil_rev_8_21_14_0_10_42_17]|uniref:Chaperone protein DnaJ n=1 Tax=Candidatus Harrisonbacteria bacterium CG10_big_fil_rev_8_21_14_0_10_42_17 TaxID=1974584 RepID=A0A2M6WHX3_9BACT|nr:MAG: molecular chaperone DnaJ [Candidatus Harrisonbacteria bacterium CG10_big_fil_rev_8_21_14_0_10_42_17]